MEEVLKKMTTLRTEKEDSDGEFDDVNGFDLVLLQIYAWLLQISF